MPVPENFKGKKGRSGRKSAREEGAKNRAIQRAWEKVFAEIDLFKTTEIALPLALKDMVAKTDVTSDGKELNAVLVQFLDDKATNNNSDTE